MKAERQQKEPQKAEFIQSKLERTKLGFIDNRSQTITQTKLINSIQKKKNKTETNLSSAYVIQKEPIPAIVRGTTHLVKVQGNSIFRGDIVKTLTHGMRIVIETDDTILSRRGPNQTFYRARDLTGPKIYKWFKVNSIEGESVEGYIRIHTFDAEYLPNFMRERVLGERRRSKGNLPQQNITLLGTIHSPENKSQDANYDPSKDLIVEYPSPYRKEPTDTKSQVGDATQNGLVEIAAGKGRIIGADGRKVFKSGKTHRLTLRHQVNFTISQEQSNVSNLMQLAMEFIDSCLGLRRVDFSQLIGRICQLVDYHDKDKGPDVPLILKNDFYRVSTITQYFKLEVKRKMRERLLQDLMAGLGSSWKDTDDEIKEYREMAEEKKALIADDTKFTEYIIKELREENEVDDFLIDDKQISARKEEEAAFIRHQLSVLDENISGLNDQYYVKLVSLFYDTICNLTLYSEVLANDNENLVVAFGNEHIKTLRILLKDLHGIHKNFKF